MKRAMLAAILAVSFLACEKKGGGGGAKAAPIELPEVFGAKPLDKQDRIEIELTADGAIRCEGRRVSLDELSEEISAQKRTRGTHKTSVFFGTELVPAGTCSDLYVLLRADHRARWQHAQYVFIVLAEEKIDRLQFAVKGGRIDASLPPDVAIEWIEEPGEITINADVLAKDPTTYRVGHREMRDVEDVIAAVMEDLKTARASVRGRNVRLIGQVRAAKTAKFGAVADLYARMQTCGFRSVEFFGTILPTRAVRKLRSLPRPADSKLIAGEHWNDEEDD